MGVLSDKKKHGHAALFVSDTPPFLVHNRAHSEGVAVVAACSCRGSPKLRRFLSEEFQRRVGHRIFLLIEQAGYL